MNLKSKNSLIIRTGGITIIIRNFSIIVLTHPRHANGLLTPHPPHAPILLENSNFNPTTLISQPRHHRASQRSPHSLRISSRSTASGTAIFLSVEQLQFMRRRFCEELFVFRYYVQIRCRFSHHNIMYFFYINLHSRH
jgi:hypothetical protein